MRQPRVYTDQPLQPGNEVLLAPATSRHLARVLRLRAGAAVRLFNGDGRELHARLTDMAKDGVRAALETLAVTEPEPRMELHLIIGASKGERMDLAIQKAVELGVTRISPLLSKRSVVRWAGQRLERRLTHWRSILVSACEQSGRCRLPQLDGPADLPRALANVRCDLRLVLHHRGAGTLERVPPPFSGVSLLVGPEGGLEAAEIRLAENEGFMPIHLGPRILRTETAPLAALAAVQMLWGDFRAD